MSNSLYAHALIVGIADYHQIKKLPETVLKDAREVYNTLIDPAISAYPKNQVQLLLNEKATLDEIRGALVKLETYSGTNSVVFIYISSHGGRIETGPDAGEYVLPVDAQLRLSGAAVELAADTAISGDEFTHAVRAIKARKLVVVFDCCHSGGIGQPKDVAAPVFKSGLPDSYYQELASGRGRVILSSSRNSEESWILPGAENSLFTQHLLAGLRGGVTSNDGIIRIFDLFEYLQPRVTEAKPIQHPVFKSDLEENFPIALFLGGQKGVVEVAQRKVIVKGRGITGSEIYVAGNSISTEHVRSPVSAGNQTADVEVDLEDIEQTQLSVAGNNLSTGKNAAVEDKYSDLATGNTEELQPSAAEEFRQTGTGERSVDTGLYQYDVFISYSHKDKEWVRNVLIPSLQKARLRVCVDEQDFAPGAYLVNEIQRAVSAAARQS